jgi:hypothetical protein
MAVGYGKKQITTTIRQDSYNWLLANGGQRGIGEIIDQLVQSKRLFSSLEDLINNRISSDAIKQATSNKKDN